MDRETVIQFVAFLVVVVALARWLPDDDPMDPLGMGVPWDTLDMERQLLELGPESDQAMTWLRTIRTPPERQAPYRRHWRELLSQLREIQADPSTAPDTLIQFRGVPRNDMWALMYLAYPLPTTFRTFEDGSRPMEDRIPGARTIDSSLQLRWEEMTEEQRARERARGGR